MSTDGPSIPSRAVPFETASTHPPAPAAPGWTWLSLLLAAAGLASGALAWNKVQSMQEVLAQQTAQANAQAQTGVGLDHVRVDGASHADGMLHIALVREIPEALKPRRIEIAKAAPRVEKLDS